MRDSRPPSPVVPASGVLLVDKQPGASSHDVVDRVRRLTGIKKVGHGGTLDPFATGLLLVLVGKATRLFDFLVTLSKEYLVTVQFGATSTTGDIDGVITPSTGGVNEPALRGVLPKFTGVFEQQVPIYSAVKTAGEPLYKKARRGEKVETPVRQVEVHSLKLESFDAGSQQAVLAVTCSKGTYIRQLCEDMGAALGTGAYAAKLRRTAIGNLSVDDARTVDGLKSVPAGALLTGDNPSFLSCLGALYFLPVREVEDSDIQAIAHGRRIKGKEAEAVRLASGGRLVAVYGPSDESGYLRPLVVLI